MLLPARIFERVFYGFNAVCALCPVAVQGYCIAHLQVLELLAEGCVVVVDTPVGVGFPPYVRFPSGDEARLEGQVNRIGIIIERIDAEMLAPPPAAR